MQMATLAKTHLARQQLANALKQFERADDIWQTDQRISGHMNNRQSSQMQSQLDMVANQTTAILSLLRRYQALAQVQAAEARLQSTLGVEPRIGGVDDMPLPQLTRALIDGQHDWFDLGQPGRQGDRS